MAAQPSFPPDLPTFSDGRFVLVSRIGQGTVGAVYRGYDRRQRGWRAFKLLTPALAGDPDARRRFVATGELFAGFAHPNVVRVYEVGALPDGAPFLVMELVNGGTLAAWVHRHGPMPPGLACGAGIELARGLGALHAHGGVHGAVVGRNGLVTTSGVRKVGDAGLGAYAGGPTDDVMSLGRLIGEIGGGQGALPAPFVEVLAGAGTTFTAADDLADALERILGELPPEPPGTPDLVLDLSAQEVGLPEVFPELASLTAGTPRPAPTAGGPPHAERRGRSAPVDPSDADGDLAHFDPDPLDAGFRAPEPTSEVLTVTPPVFEPLPDLPRPPEEPSEAVDDEVTVQAPTRSPLPPPPGATWHPPAAPPIAPLSAATTTSTPAPVTLGEGRRSVPPSPPPAAQKRAPVPRAPAKKPEVVVSAEGANPSVSGAQAHSATGSVDGASTALGCLRWVFVPIALGGVLGLIGFAIVAVLLGIAAVDVNSEAGEAHASEEQLYRSLDADRAAIDRLAELSGERTKIESAYAAYIDHRMDAGRLHAALALADLLTSEADGLGDKLGSSVSEVELTHRMRQLRAAHRRYLEDVDAWREAANTMRGRTAVTIGLAPAPPET